jgi:glycosyltransferase involved in cell wall biosynthesis
MRNPKVIRVSVIIPTYNEEKFLPRLLKSLNDQTFQDFEVIVADANSKDRTVSIAKKMGAKVVKGGLPGVGRNAGARVAKGELLFFFDADVDLPLDFMEKAYHEMQENFYDVATCEFVPMSDIQLDKVIHNFMNMAVKTSLRVDPKAFGFCIFCSKRLFNRINGFDESVRVGEDCDFVRRASKIRPLEYLYSTKIWVSVRRFAKEGRLAYAKKGIRLNLLRALKGEIKDDSIEYEFGGYDTKDTFRKKSLLDHLEKLLLRMEDTEKQKRQHKIDHKDFKLDEKKQQTQYKAAVKDIRRLFNTSEEENKLGPAAVTSLFLVILLILAFYGPLFPWSPIKPGYESIRLNKAVIHTTDPGKLHPQYRQIDNMMLQNEALLGLKYKSRVKVIVCNSYSEMSRFVPWISRIPSFALETGDVAYFSPQIRENNLNVTEYIQRELTHLAFFQNSSFLKSFTIKKQKWISEGIAAYAGGPAYMSKQEFIRQFKSKKLKADSSEPYLFQGIEKSEHAFNYTLSKYLVSYLAETYGREKLVKFLKAYVQSPADVEDLFRETYGIKLQDLAARFSRSL